MTAINGLRGTGDWSDGERPKSFRESILWYKPNGNAPLFALTSKMRKKTVTDPEFSWWAEGMNHIRLQVAGQLASGDTLVTVDSLDPTTTTMGALYGTARHLKPGDLLLVEPATDAETFDHELLLVTDVISDTQFSVQRGAGGTTAATIANDLFLLKIGSAYAEGTSAPEPTTRNPLKFQNYIQIFKTAYELTGTAAETELRTGNPWSNDKKRKMFDHSRDIEMSLLFGRAYETTGDNGKPLRFMGGLRSQIPPENVTVFSSGVDMSAFADAIGPFFDFDMGGGDTRIAFAGNQALLELGKAVQGETGISIEMKQPITSWGMNFHEYSLPNGRLLMKSHPLMSAHPLYKKSMFIIDPGSLAYVVQRGRPDGKVLDDVQTKEEDVRRGFIHTDCSLLVDGGGLSNGYLGNISAT